MLDIIYINDKTKRLLHFAITGKSFLELFNEFKNTQKVIEATRYHFESMVSQFGIELDFPAQFIEVMDDEEMDILMIELEYNYKRLFKEQFFVVIPFELIRQFSDNETLNTYCTLGVNREAVLIRSEGAANIHIAAATHLEFKERFELLGKVA